jgi:D-sedoheptulose 7-phosphate isomerase
MPGHCDHCLHVPSDATPRIQEGHISIGHTICYLIEQQIFPRAEPDRSA